jgi:hypothetical protein
MVTTVKLSGLYYSIFSFFPFAPFFLAIVRGVLRFTHLVTLLVPANFSVLELSSDEQFQLEYYGHLFKVLLWILFSKK